MADPLTVSFDIEPGQVWVDPDGVAWVVAFTDLNTVHLSRKAVTEVDAVELVRIWRRALSNGPSGAGGTEDG